MASRSIPTRLRSGLIVAMAAAMLALVPSASASSTQPFHLTKDCDAFTGVAPTYCTVHTSNVPAIQAGDQIWYYGPVVALTAPSTSSVVVIKAQSGTASGFCRVANTTGSGTCVFWEGTGSLRGFRALIAVSYVPADPGYFHWDGWYSIASH